MKKTKILFCEKNFSGHRRTYLANLAKLDGFETFVYAPENIGMDAEHFFSYAGSQTLKTAKAYLYWIREIRKIVAEKQIDVVHILDGDSLMRFFGIGFQWLGAKKLVITYHHFFDGKLRQISYRMMSAGRNTVCVVHTNSVRQQLCQMGVENIEVCQYPAFDYECFAQRDSVSSREYFSLPSDKPVIGIVGGMTRYKNIIPFLNIMKKCKTPFHLLICGSESDVSKEEIEAAVQPYAENVTMQIRHLSQEEYQSAIVASDIIYSLYGKEFDGASGPLTDGVCAGKMILSCDHGSLGEIVRENELGVIADCDDEEDMLRRTEEALRVGRGFAYTGKASKYAEELKPEVFADRYRIIYRM
ncbi:MAG: glycosyltransferase family 4 protein [Clostridia bacterium]|nr:glycosyltransferase family 4 protein [Clostridia bacterium]